MGILVSEMLDELREVIAGHGMITTANQVGVEIQVVRSHKV